MHTVNSIQVGAAPGDVFQLAAQVERWPEILPHYRWVKVFWRHGSTCLVEMAARKGVIPVKWTSVQQCSKKDLRIVYKHVAGLTEGMWVEWKIEPASDGVGVTIVHELTLVKPLINSRLGRWIVGEVFVKSIADRTLSFLKKCAEEQVGASDMSEESDRRAA